VERVSNRFSKIGKIVGIFFKMRKLQQKAPYLLGLPHENSRYGTFLTCENFNHMYRLDLKQKKMSTFLKCKNGNNRYLLDLTHVHDIKEIEF
jgi:hypothetical protein